MQRRALGLLLPLLVVALFSGATLLFVVEPMFAKLLLPLLGSTPAVWNTSVVFFQAVLLGGYVYAHLAMTRLPLRRQVQLHAVVLLLPLLALPLRLPGWSPPTTGSPVPWLLLVLTVSVGLPFFVLASTAPLVQGWFSQTSHRSAADPYFLYRASNLGSMVALVGYPTVVEPHLTLGGQARLWSVGYAVVALLLATTAGAVAVAAGGVPRDRADPADTATDLARLASRRWLRWVCLAAVPSMWMLALTSYLTTQVAPVPMLWVIPLALYLLSFTIVFARRPLVRQRWLRWVAPFLLLPLVGTLVLHASGPLWFLFPLHVATFFVAALICHGELAADRPSVRHLTAFYLWLAVGGVLGGVLAALVAPMVFSDFTEYPVSIVLMCLIVPLRRGRMGESGWWRGGDLVLPVAIAGLVVVATLVFLRDASIPDAAQHALLFGPAALLAFVALSRPARFGLAIAALLVASSLPLGRHEQQLFATRDFYGVSRVTVGLSGAQHILYSGSIVHGAQNLTASQRDEPLTYYSSTGPVGDLFAALRTTRTTGGISVIGLGAGSMACYARPGDQWTFYEIDPVVYRIATDPALFTFLHDCRDARANVIIGDGRLSIAHAVPHSQRLIVIDAFGSDVIPLHLLTKQALQQYRSTLGDNGILGFNISNQYVDLEPVLARLARELHLVAYVRDNGAVTPADAATTRFASTWLVMAPDDASLGGLPLRPGWRLARAPAGTPLWTDDFTDLFSVLRWKS